MTPETIKYLQDAGNILLGAAIGLAGATWSDWWKNRKKARAMQTAIRLELRETAHRFLGLVYIVGGRHGHFDRALIEWIVYQADRYTGSNPREGILTGMRGMLGQSDEQIAAASAHLQATTKSQYTPLEIPAYTAASVAALHDLDPDYAARVLDILAHVRMLNDARESGMFYQRLTFTPDLTEENYASAQNGINAAERNMFSRARIIIDKITQLEERYPQK